MDSLKKLLGGGTPHTYKTQTPVARLQPGEDASARVEQAQDLLVANPTPSSSNAPATVAGARNTIGWLGSVTSFLDPSRGTVTNVTVDDKHLLAPGTVTSYVERQGDTLYVVREGTGSGILPKTNVRLADPVWHIADDRITRGLNPEYAAAHERAQEHVLSHVDMNDPDGSFLAGWQASGMIQSAYHKIFKD